MYGRAMQTACCQRRHSIPARVNRVHGEGISEGRACSSSPSCKPSWSGVCIATTRWPAREECFFVLSTLPGFAGPRAIVCVRTCACRDRCRGMNVRPRASWHGPRTALVCAYCSDSMTRDSPVALRVHGAQTETRKGERVWGLGAPPKLNVKPAAMPLARAPCLVAYTLMSCLSGLQQHVAC